MLDDGTEKLSDVLRLALLCVFDAQCTIFGSIPRGRASDHTLVRSSACCLVANIFLFSTLSFNEGMVDGSWRRLIPNRTFPSAAAFLIFSVVSSSANTGTLLTETISSPTFSNEQNAGEPGAMDST